VQAIAYDLIDRADPSTPIAQVHRNESIDIQTLDRGTVRSTRVSVPYESLPVDIGSYSLIQHHNEHSIQSPVASAQKGQSLEARGTLWDVNCISPRRKSKYWVTSVGPGAEISVFQGSKEHSSVNAQEPQGRAGACTQAFGSSVGSVPPS
jgi:hypothetical protein